MFISPKTAFENGWIVPGENFNQEVQVGSDGIDLTVKSISRIESHGNTGLSVITNSKASTVHRHLTPVVPKTAAELSIEDQVNTDPDSLLYLLHEGAYDIEFNEFVTLPQGVAALLLLRSTFVRAGHQMASGLYDQGFSNFAGSVLHINGMAAVEQNVRLAQIVFIASEGSGALYAGGYNYQEGDKTWADAAARQGSTQR